MKIIKVILILLLYSCNIESERAVSEVLADEEKAKGYKFYDFDFQLIKYFSPLGVSEKFIVRNYGETTLAALKENHLYYIRYADQENGTKFLQPDTLEIKLNKAELDSLFSITSNYIRLKHSINVSPYKIPPPPGADSEWEYAEITLDLGFRGDKHSVVTTRFSKLYKYLINLKNKKHE